jgi:large subunit ribosomal protein L19
MAIKVSPIDIEKRKKIDVSSGNTVRVWQKIQEKGKTRLQAFEGLIIAHKHGTEAGATFTVRKVASGVGVEKTFPLFSPLIDKIEVVRRAKVRRAKLYYIREKVAKEVRRAMRNIQATRVEEAEDTEEIKEAESVESSN